MLAALKQSTESRQLVELAKKYLQGVRGTLVQAKKLKAEKAVQRTALALQIAGGSNVVGSGTVGQNGQYVQAQAQKQIQHHAGPSTGVSKATVTQKISDVRPATSSGAPALQVRQYVPLPQKVTGQGHQGNGGEGGAGGTWRDVSKG